MILEQNDLLGAACDLFYRTKQDVPIYVAINGKADESLMPSYFFRQSADLNPIERAAIANCRGPVLDVGAGAGCHSLILQRKSIEITSLEKSALLSKIMADRGVKRIVNEDILNFKNGSFETILLMMNGFGLAGSDDKLPNLIQHLAGMLRRGGSIIGDSTDINYFFGRADSSIVLGLKNGYYGNVHFSLSWHHMQDSFPWLFADEWLLRDTCKQLGLKFGILRRGSGNQFLCRITLS
jgi:SAM-dependent methyltransferase